MVRAVRVSTDVTAFDEAERRAWAGRAEAYERSFAALCAHPVPALLDAADVRPGLRVLDAGTGTGAAARAAVERGAAVTAVDADPGMAARAASAAADAAVCVAALPRLPFADGRFDAVVGNFVLNHVGRPRAALAELRRVARPGARIALTIWATPPAPGQALFGRAIRAAGVSRPDHLPTLAPEDDFARTEEGFALLLRDAGLADVRCRTLTWEHRAGAEEWWSGPAAGVASVGQVVVSQTPATVAEIRHRYDALCAEFAGADGRLVLPHSALVGSGRV
ncbi:class I SAM-dependent methyltransferase [Streptomyces sp. NPDC059788]|uniref:class I SAM-dependent methyltransferase n=1 Tax=Streptomyces sp. NPDC059788 TaxID=3346948 RepID=UPI00364D2F1D